MKAAALLLAPAVLLGAIPAAGCAAPDVAGKWKDPPEPVRALLRRAEVALYEDRVVEALATAWAAVNLDPDGVDGLRVLQTVRTAAGDEGSLEREAEASVQERPEDPAALFLLARLEGDGRRAMSLLDDCLAVDPAFLWARLGRAQIAMAAGAPGDAADDLLLAEETAPGHPWVPLVRAQLALRNSHPARALEHLELAVLRDPGSFRAREGLARALRRVPGREEEARAQIREAFRIAPGSRSAAAEWREALEEGGGAPPSEVEDAAACVDAAEAAGRITPQSRHLRGSARLALGEPARALPDLAAALEALEDRTSVLDDLRLALFSLGRYADALAAEESCTPPGLLHDPESEVAPLRAALAEAARALEGAPADPALLARFTDLCRRAGWLREAALLAGRRVALDPEDPEALADAVEAARTLRFLAEFRALWRGAYHGYEGGGDGGDMDRALAALAGMSRGTLGVDLTEGISRREFALLGELAESVRAEGPCRAWFDAHGLALVVGRPSGEPVEARLLRVVSLRREREEEVLGRRFPATVVVGEGLLVPSRRESGGAVLGGATVGDLVFVDLEGIARWSGSAVRARREPAIREVLEAVEPLRAEDEARETSLRFPGRLPERIALAVDGWSDPRAVLADFLDAARWHELAHAAQAGRYLPILGHPLAGLQLLLRGRLSGGHVAAVLEGDAEMVALAESREPRAALATMVSFLPSRDSQPPHSRGYHGAVADLVEVLRERRAVAPGWNVARSLDRLSPEVLRSAAREVCRRRGLSGD